MKGEAGNALFLILIAVALFAALSYAVTQSGRGGGGADQEQTSLDVARLFQYASNIDQAVMRMMIINRCSETGISFEGAEFGNYSHSPAAKAECKLYDSEGGGLPYERLDFSTVGSKNPAFYRDISVVGVGTGASDLVMVMHNVGSDVCAEIFRREGLPVFPAGDGVGGANIFKGIYPPPAGVIGDQAAELAGHMAGCFADGPDYKHFYYVLVAR
tara:strand:- start:57 stop:701 length:645 start_codon:yes stop_codon:yes gene_type:complete